MKVFIGIDDTDDIDSLGTGEFAEILAKTVDERGWGKCSKVTRHQLFVHPDIPYTSHNSSMCFVSELAETKLEALISYAGEFLARETAKGSDPGLCVAVVDKVSNPELLMEFGGKAKKIVVTKDEAYGLAEKLGVHLSEHGGTGQGIIGALAGVGLRLTGNDGRFKGKYKINSAGNVATVEEIIAQTNIDMVKAIDGTVLKADEAVYLGEKVKSVLLDHRCVLLVAPVEKASDEKASDEVKWETCSMKYLKKADFKISCLIAQECSGFVIDVEDEIFSEFELTCTNCRYRRWTNTGFSCLKGLTRFRPRL